MVPALTPSPPLMDVLTDSKNKNKSGNGRRGKSGYKPETNSSEIDFTYETSFFTPMINRISTETSGYYHDGSRFSEL
jgi:hypothetical protein